MQSMMSTACCTDAWRTSPAALPSWTPSVGSWPLAPKSIRSYSNFLLGYIFDDADDCRKTTIIETWHKLFSLCMCVSIIFYIIIHLWSCWLWQNIMKSLAFNTTGSLYTAVKQTGGSNDGLFIHNQQKVIVLSKFHSCSSIQKHLQPAGDRHLFRVLIVSFCALVQGPAFVPSYQSFCVFYFLKVNVGGSVFHLSTKSEWTRVVCNVYTWRPLGTTNDFNHLYRRCKKKSWKSTKRSNK